MTGPIAVVEYPSIPPTPWKNGRGVTRNLFDDATEDLRIDLAQVLGKGTHTLAVRVADSAGNVGSTSVTFQIK